MSFPVNTKKYTSPSAIFAALQTRETVQGLCRWRVWCLDRADGDPVEAVRIMHAPRERGAYIDALAQDVSLRVKEETPFAEMMRSYFNNVMYTRTQLANELHVWNDKYKIRGRVDSVEREERRGIKKTCIVVNDWKGITKESKISEKLPQYMKQLGAYSLMLPKPENVDKYRLTFFAGDAPHPIIHDFSPDTIAESADDFLNDLTRYLQLPEIEVEHVIFSRKPFSSAPVHETPAALLDHYPDRWTKRKRANQMVPEWCEEIYNTAF